MSGQYPTPISIAGSYDDSEPSRKKVRPGDYQDVIPGQAGSRAPESSTAMYKLLEESCRSFQDTDMPTEHSFGQSPRGLHSGFIYNRTTAETDLSVWGYMISNVSESLSFLLSKESRCGAKKRAWKSPLEAHRGDGVILKDYNGDNIASSGYLIGRHSECDVVIDSEGISERHCVIFKINITVQTGSLPEDNKRPGDVITQRVEQRVFLQDISGRGTYVNSALLKRNDIARLNDNDILSLSADGPSWTFRRPHNVSHKPFEDRFQSGRTIGHGHFAEVVEVQERSTGQRFAAKMIRKNLVTDDKTFLQEIGLLMSCTHPLITCIRDVFDVGDRIYLILELAAGGELFDRIILKGKFSEDETRVLFRQIFSALRYLHAHSIVHRDIKPENILLVSKDTLDIRLADFGLAKIVGNSTSTSILAGTPSYIPPEMLATPTAGKSLSYSTKVDSWSAGVVLYICLCGFPPFSQELAPPPMRTQIKEGLYQFQKPYWDSVSDVAIDLVQRLLTVDPAMRLSIPEALQHPFMLVESTYDSTPRQIDVSKARQGIKRQRTMLQDLGRPEIKHV